MKLGPERAYCGSCRGERLWRWISTTETLPSAIAWSCLACGFRRIAYADVGDAENLCRTVLDRHLRNVGSDGGAEREDMLAGLYVELWAIYLSWKPDTGVPFAAYGTGILRLRVSDYWRAKLGRDGKKPLGSALPLASDERALGFALAAGASDPATGSSPGLAGILSRADRGTLRAEREMGFGPPERATSGD